MNPYSNSMHSNNCYALKGEPEINKPLFALGRALIGVICAWLIARSGKQPKKTTLIVSPCSKLLDANDRVKPDVQITYRVTSIKDLDTEEFAAQNTAIKAIDNIEIDVVQSPNSPLLDFETSSGDFSAHKLALDIKMRHEPITGTPDRCSYMLFMAFLYSRVHYHLLPFVLGDKSGKHITRQFYLTPKN
jgi:hypothetical protein